MIVLVKEMKETSVTDTRTSGILYSILRALLDLFSRARRRANNADARFEAVSAYS
jgi:hypothetical protein